MDFKKSKIGNYPWSRGKGIRIIISRFETRAFPLEKIKK
jgi:hypothetical protein